MTTTEPIFIDVRMWDNSTSTLRLFLPSPESAEKTPRPIIVICPGYGMGARYYDPIAAELASRGFYVATSELHGQGSNTARASREHDFGYHHMAALDLPASIETAKEHFNLPRDYPTYLLCHSRGGQIAAVFAARPEVEDLGIRGIMGVGTGSPYWKGFRGKQRLRMRHGTRIMELIVRIFGHQPDGIWDIAGYGRQPKTFILEWLHCLRTNRLPQLKDQDLDYAMAFSQINIPILLTRYSNDDECTLRSIRYFAENLPTSWVAIEELPEPFGHNKWARTPHSAANRLEKYITEGLPSDNRI